MTDAETVERLKHIVNDDLVNLQVLLDELYARGWADRHRGRDYDPRGSDEWRAVFDLQTQHPAQR
jgi:hypothetical protein